MTPNTTPPSHTAFFYGTLMAPAVLHRVILGPQTTQPDRDALLRARNLTVRPALLHGYRRHRVARADYPGIIENRSSVVRGSLVTGLTEGDMWRLDQFEGNEYARKQVRVKVLREQKKRTSGVSAELPPPATKEGKEEGEEVLAETYVWIRDFRHLKREEWDFDEFVKEKMWRWVDQGGEVEGEYAELDAAVESSEQHAGESADPTGGRGRNGSISKMLQQTPVLS